jgi:hypothetical protein
MNGCDNERQKKTLILGGGETSSISSFCWLRFVSMKNDALC